MSRTKIGLFANGSQDYLVLVNMFSALVTALSEGTEPRKATYQISCLLYKVMSTKTNVEFVLIYFAHFDLILGIEYKEGHTN